MIDKIVIPEEEKKVCCLYVKLKPSHAAWGKAK